MEFEKELENIKNQIIDKFDPIKIIVFGSYAKGIFKDDSDLDICVVLKFDIAEKKDLMTRFYIEIESDVPYDIVLYKPETWEKYKDNKDYFAYIINEEGVEIYG